MQAANAAEGQAFLCTTVVHIPVIVLMESAATVTTQQESWSVFFFRKRGEAVTLEALVRRFNTRGQSRIWSSHWGFTKFRGQKVVLQQERPGQCSDVDLIAKQTNTVWDTVVVQGLVQVHMHRNSKPCIEVFFFYHGYEESNASDKFILVLLLFKCVPRILWPVWEVVRISSHPQSVKKLKLQQVNRSNLLRSLEYSSC